MVDDVMASARDSLRDNRLSVGEALAGGEGFPGSGEARGDRNSLTRFVTRFPPAMTRSWTRFCLRIYIGVQQTLTDIGNSKPLSFHPE